MRMNAVTRILALTGERSKIKELSEKQEKKQEKETPKVILHVDIRTGKILIDRINEVLKLGDSRERSAKQEERKRIRARDSKEVIRRICALRFQTSSVKRRLG